MYLALLMVIAFLLSLVVMRALLQGKSQPRSVPVRVNQNRSRRRY
jgi:hypothetical protein